MERYFKTALKYSIQQLVVTIASINVAIIEVVVVTSLLVVGVTEVQQTVEE